jgi:hypothetical protein
MELEEWMKRIGGGGVRGEMREGKRGRERTKGGAGGAC